MKADTLNRKLLKALPELTEEYEAETCWQEGDKTGSHVVFGDVLVPYLRDAICNNEIEIVQKVFAFLKEEWILNDEYSQDVIAVSVLESMADLWEKYEEIFDRLDEDMKNIIRSFV
ncbi:hypothetical protein LJC32_05595 [Oscillospiraceae bacterium OttesenSCG-928-F05]|nr:hypothetical protein [Oscillospiraceae bacterium OttesenSCG-928-F05]